MSGTVTKTNGLNLHKFVNTLQGYKLEPCVCDVKTGIPVTITKEICGRSMGNFPVCSYAIGPAWKNATVLSIDYQKKLLYFLSTEALIDCIAFSSIKNVVKDGLRPANEPTIVPVSPGKPCIFLPDLLETKFPVVHLEEYSSPFSVVNGAKETLKNFSRESLHASFESTGQKLQCLYITIQLEHDSEVYFACSTVSQRDHIFKRLRQIKHSVQPTDDYTLAIHHCSAYNRMSWFSSSSVYLVVLPGRIFEYERSAKMNPVDFSVCPRRVITLFNQHPPVFVSKTFAVSVTIKSFTPEPITIEYQFNDHNSGERFFQALSICREMWAYEEIRRKSVLPIPKNHSSMHNSTHQSSKGTISVRNGSSRTPIFQQQPKQLNAITPNRFTYLMEEVSSLASLASEYAKLARANKSLRATHNLPLLSLGNAEGTLEDVVKLVKILWNLHSTHATTEDAVRAEEALLAMEVSELKPLIAEIESLMVSNTTIRRRRLSAPSSVFSRVSSSTVDSNNSGSCFSSPMSDISLEEIEDDTPRKTAFKNLKPRASSSSRVFVDSSGHFLPPISEEEAPPKKVKAIVKIIHRSDTMPEDALNIQRDLFSPANAASGREMRGSNFFQSICYSERSLGSIEDSKYDMDQTINSVDTPTAAIGGSRFSNARLADSPLINANSSLEISNLLDNDVIKLGENDSQVSRSAQMSPQLSEHDSQVSRSAQMSPQLSPSISTDDNASDQDCFSSNYSSYRQSPVEEILSQEEGYVRPVEFIKRVEMSQDSSLIVEEYMIQKFTNEWFIAAEEGDAEKVESMLAAGMVSLHARGIDNWTVFHFAARKGRTNVMRCLLSHVSSNSRQLSKQPSAKALINALSKSSWSPLMLACSGGHNDVADMLVLAGADVYAKNNQLQTAIDLTTCSTMRRVLLLSAMKTTPMNHNYKS